jgi:uncharacterized membrane protein
MAEFHPLLPEHTGMNEYSEKIIQGLTMENVKRAIPIVGSGLVLFGMARRTPLSVILAALGGGMIYEGLQHLNRANGKVYEKGMPTQMTVAHNQGIRVEEAVIIKRSPEDLYRFWRNFENLPRVMRYLESVRVITPTRSHWVAKAPAGQTVAWDAEIISEKENERIGWRSMEGAIVPNAGSVHFSPAPSGIAAIVRVNLMYSPPGGQIGDAFAKAFGTSPSTTVAEDLRRFKSMMEMDEATIANY